MCHAFLCSVSFLSRVRCPPPPLSPRSKQTVRFISVVGFSRGRRAREVFSMTLTLVCPPRCPPPPFGAPVFRRPQLPRWLEDSYLGRSQELPDPPANANAFLPPPPRALLAPWKVFTPGSGEVDGASAPPNPTALLDMWVAGFGGLFRAGGGKSFFFFARRLLCVRVENDKKSDKRLASCVLAFG